jgi:hypothetical protein
MYFHPFICKTHAWEDIAFIDVQSVVVIKLTMLPDWALIPKASKR